MLVPLTLVVQLVIIQLVMVQWCCYAYCRCWCTQFSTRVQADQWKVTAFLNLCLAMCYCMFVESPDPSSVNCTVVSVTPVLSHVGIGSNAVQYTLCSVHIPVQDAAAWSENARFKVSSVEYDKHVHGITT